MKYKKYNIKKYKRHDKEKNTKKLKNTKKWLENKERIEDDKHKEWNTINRK